MKKLSFVAALLLILFSFLAADIQAQPCTNLPPGPELFLNNQSDVDNFQANYGPCTVMPPGKGITLNFSTATNLDGLNALTSIGGQLFIGFTPLDNVDGLSYLADVGGNLIIIQNSNLTNLDGLRSLTTVGGGLDISVNPSLQHVDGLARLSTVATNFNVFGNASLNNLDGFCGITSVAGPNGQNGQFAIVNNSALAACCAMNPFLSTFPGPVIIFGNLPGCNTQAEIASCAVIPPCVPLPLPVPVPTIGTWGLILLALLLSGIGVTALQPQLQLAGVQGEWYHVFSQILNDKIALLRNFIIAGSAIAVLFAVSIAFFGYELMPFDVTGSILAAALLAYIMQILTKK